VISERLQRAKYVIGDYLSSTLALLAFYCTRYWMDAVYGNFDTVFDYLRMPMVMAGMLLFPILMMGVYYLSGYYNEVFRKSRLQEFFTTLWSAMANTLIVYFLALINDAVFERTLNYELILLLWGLLFVFVYIVRLCITSDASRRIKNRQWKFNTLMVGRGSAAVAFVNKLNNMRHSTGYHVVGFVSIPGENDVKDLDYPGYQLDEIAAVCEREKIHEIIVVPTRQDQSAIMSTVNKLFALNLPIMVSPDKMNLPLSRVRLSNIYGDPLVDISRGSYSEFSKNIKRLIDIVVSAIMLILLIPVYLIVALCIKLDSRGPVLFLQERVGYRNHLFTIVKFRTMVPDAEEGGVPRLSSDNDPRVTRVGRFMRKYRIDELPQFWNVLRGDMSLVGPRPERQYFVDQILKKAPSYALLHQVRPGITSLGMVQYGYARNVDEMVERMAYDLMYLENMSLLNDIKILIFTVKIVFTGRGM